MSLTKSPSSQEARRTTLLWAGGALLASLLARLLLWLSYSPVAYSDSPSYRRLGEALLDGLGRYDGTRTPGYPAFLALVGGDERVWLAQIALGVLVALILFAIGWQLSGRGWFGALLALAHALNLGQLLFEANLLTETLTTFLLAVSAIGIFTLLRAERRPRAALAAGTGLAVALTLLTRPLFVYLPVWAGLFILWGAHRRVQITRLILFSLPVLLLVGGWVVYIHNRFGGWGLTTMTGYHLVQHTGAYFEYVPDEYAALREIYLRHRDAQIAANGTQTNAIWEAIPEMSQTTGLNFYDLSDTLANISVRLILEHPGLYLQNVAQGWWMFWRAPVYWSPEALQIPALAGVLSSLISIQRPLLWAVNGIFIFGSLLWAGICYIPARLIDRMPAWLRRLRADFHSQDNSPRAQSTHRWMLFLAGSIWIASILQSLLDHGDNPRFLVPLQSWVVLWVAWFCYTCWRSFFIERETAHEK